MGSQNIKEEIKRVSRDKWKWKHDNLKPIGYSKSSSNGEIFSNTFLLQEIRKIANEQPKFTLKARRERTSKPKVSSREIINIRAERN